MRRGAVNRGAGVMVRSAARAWAGRCGAAGCAVCIQDRGTGGRGGCGNMVSCFGHALGPKAILSEMRNYPWQIAFMEAYRRRFKRPRLTGVWLGAGKGGVWELGPGTGGKTLLDQITTTHDSV